MGRFIYLGSLHLVFRVPEDAPDQLCRRGCGAVAFDQNEMKISASVTLTNEKGNKT